MLIAFIGNAQQMVQKNEQKIVLITIDGLRWQELFTGADSLLIVNKEYVEDTAKLRSDFWRNTQTERRETLMPFFWRQIIKIGQLHGNRNADSKVNLTNTMRFSYPGYNEILTGKADDKRIDSNSKINNPNITILEKINNQSQYVGKVAAFGSWDVFPYIINAERSGVPVNAGFDIAKGGDLSEREVFLNQLQPQVPSPWGTVRLDAFTHHYALEYMKRKHPKFIYISYGETDDFAHDGNYQAYLNSAHTTDALIEELWNFTQKDEFYKDNTIFIVSTDHGRGTKPLETWKSHGSEIKGAGQVWMVMFGNGVKTLGEVTSDEQLYSNQIAPTILDLFNIKIDSKAIFGKPLDILSEE
jgi:hypothetical protein